MLLLPITTAAIRCTVSDSSTDIVPDLELVQLPLEEVALVLDGDADLGGHLVGVAADVEPVGEAAEGLLEGQGLLDVGVDVGPGQPLVAQLRAAVQVHRGDNAHVALAPLAAAVGDLVLEQLQRVEPQLGLRHLERLADDVRRLVLHQQQVPVRLALADLLHDPQVVNQREEVAPRELCDGLLRERVDG